jgi:uncharacterized protein
MKKRLITFLITALFLFLSFPAFAQTRVVDNAGLLTAGEIRELEGLMAEIAGTYDFDLVIVTEGSIGVVDSFDYADGFFDGNGYGIGASRDGCLLLLVMDIRERVFSTNGRGVKMLNATADKRLEKNILAYLRNDNWAEAFRAYVSTWETFLALDAKGKSYNILTEHAPVFYIVSWAIAIIIGLIYVAALKKQMNTVFLKTEANVFIAPGSLNFTRKQDNYLYSTTTKTKIESSSSGGGRSSGSSHGGSRGRF